MPEPARRPALYVVASSDAPSDEEIVRAFDQRDARVAGALYDKVSPAVDRAIVRVLGRREADHDDLVQASLEQIVISLGKGRFSGASSLSTWASSIACHVALNALRKRRRERRVIDHDGALDDESMGASSERAAARVDLERVRACLAELSPEKAEALLLHDVLGHDLSEIASMTGVSVAAAQTRLSRGRRELEEKMQDGKRRRP